MAFPVISTYRVQMRGRSNGFGFTFADAENLLDYLDDLGVSHLYLSPILTAVGGSTHGYDVTDPTTVSPELGGSDGLARLSAAARSRGMGLIVDIVPSHVGVGKPEQNAWWWDVLKFGRSSAYAEFFDIDWELGDGRIILPLLGSDSDVANLRVDGDLLRLGDLALPVAPGSGDGTGPAVHDRQHYRLVGWRHGLCGYRRFFSITSLAGLRQEDRAVFDASHAEVARWFTEGLVDGVRVDHLDGLSDPSGYLAQLRELLGPNAWIVVEKILAVDEALEPTLPVDGSTGYDVLREIGGVLVDPQGESPLTALVESAVWTIRRCRRCWPTSRCTRPSIRWPVSFADCGDASRRRPAPIIRCCPRRWLHCCATSDAIAVITPAKPPSYPARWLKPIRQHHNWHLDCS